MIRNLTRFSTLRVTPRFSVVTSACRPFHSSRFALQDHKPEEPKPAEGEAEPKTEKAETKAEKSAEQILLEKKDAEIDEWKRKYLTSLADMENLRTRTRNEIADAKKYAGTEFAKCMLEVADNLLFAIRAAEADATDNNPKLKAFFEGITMTNDALIKAFAANSVVMYKSLGEKFDPHLHMGLYQLEDHTKEPGTIGNVIKEGYKIQDRVLRAAQVGTVKKSPPPPSS